MHSNNTMKKLTQPAGSGSDQVDAFLAQLKHPLKAEMEALRKIIRGASPKIQEDVKWGGPSFDYKEPMATMNPRITDYVALIFHKGDLLQDKTGFLEPGPKEKAYLKLRSMDEIRTGKAKLEGVVRAWVKLMDARPDLP